MFRLFLATTVAIVAVSPLAAQSTPNAKSVLKTQYMTDTDSEFARVDANKDGQMTRLEIETFQRSVATRMAAARNAAVFTALDSDKNGQISAAEFAKLNGGAAKVDASGVLRVDANKDGKISLAEHRSARLDTFTMLDANKDGALTAAEVKTAQAAK